MAPLAGPDALELLRAGTLELEGRLVEASNTTLRAYLTLDGVSARCVYKPVRGERPLWDFPDGTLAGREVSAYLLAEATGWACVPPTVLRDGPLGPGACQLWIEESDEAEQVLGFVPADAVPEGWYGVMSAQDSDGSPYVLAHADDLRLSHLAVFDVVANNADRKGGHILSTVDGHVYGVDHGLCFHVENKLRTILWGWIGEPLPDPAVEVLGKLRAELSGTLGAALAEHLTVTEVARVGTRVDALLAAGRFPAPSRAWPAVPWPPV
ncbi:MAG: phosphatidylinositol kinase [Actinobacteria bacterium 13_1_20CM_3_71_11]|nr:MAG: phosphatidylinositol kinase [Actinobacteria bacterium 13_1_20CM_3_71_11]